MKRIFIKCLVVVGLGLATIGGVQSSASADLVTQVELVIKPSASGSDCWDVYITRAGGAPFPYNINNKDYIINCPDCTVTSAVSDGGANPNPATSVSINVQHTANQITGTITDTTLGAPFPNPFEQTKILTFCCSNTSTTGGGFTTTYEYDGSFTIHYVPELPAKAAVPLGVVLMSTLLYLGKRRVRSVVSGATRSP